jgi:hypothetical protein
MNHLENWHSGCFTAPQMPYNNIMFNTPTMNDTINELTVTKSLRLLRDGFKSEFATFVFADERTTELFAELASEFVDANIPVVDEDNRMDLAMMLLESLDIIAR